MLEGRDCKGVADCLDELASRWLDKESSTSACAVVCSAGCSRSCAVHAALQSSGAARQARDTGR
jgi:hypothetical protein